ncbi:PH domain-containing protein [Alteromonas flava]|uniref:PH domain-containing protein n=1 Tax=Alteromonas flava TaxID=2048003 RepID=UPI000C28A20F|nr:PH domain-containing protein [Alteromonas flava]
MLMQWQRVHPVALLYFTEQALRIGVSNLVFLIPLAIALRSTFAENPTRVLLLLGMIVTVGIGIIIANYLAFRFRVHEQHVEIHKGLLKRVKLNLPFDKIQDVRLSQPIYYRLHDMRVVTLDTAGSGKDEGVIVAMAKEQADKLSDWITAYSGNSTDAASDPKENTLDTNRQLLERHISDLIIHGMSNNRVWIFLGLLSPFIDDAVKYMDSSMTTIDLRSLYAINEHGLLLVSLTVALTGMLLLVIVTLLSVAGAIINFYGFRLSLRAQRLQQQSGLFTRRQVSLNLLRIQHIEYRQTWLDGLFGRVNLTYKQLARPVAMPGDEKQSLLVPSITPAQAEDLGQLAFNHTPPKNISFQPISRRFMLKHSLVFTGLSALLALGINLEVNFKLPFVALLLVPIILQGLVILRWYRWGFAFDDKQLYVRSGLFGHTIVVAPWHKMQYTQLNVSWLQQRHQLATAQLGFASAPITIPMLKQSDAILLLEKALKAAANPNQRWM